MTTSELHIAIDLLLQKLNSHYNKNIDSIEKDIILNKAINNYIFTKINPRSNIRGLGFDNTIKRVEELNPLIVTKSLDIQYENDKCYYELPYDYLNYISSNIIVKCSNTNINLDTKPKYIINNIESVKELINYSLSAKVGTETLELFNSNNIPKDYITSDNIYNINTDFLFNNTFNILINKSILKLKETLPLYNTESNLYKFINTLEYKFNNITNKFVFKSDIDFELIYKGDIDNKVFNTVKSDIQYVNSDSVLSLEGMIVERDYLPQILKNTLATHNSQSIVCYRDKDKVYLYKNNNSKFYPIKVDLIYIRKPTTVSAKLDSNSELSYSTLQEILSLTDRMLKGILSMDSYNNSINEYSLIE